MTKKQGPSKTPVRAEFFSEPYFGCKHAGSTESVMHATQRQAKGGGGGGGGGDEMVAVAARRWRRGRRIVADLEVALRAETARRLGF